MIKLSAWFKLTNIYTPFDNNVTFSNWVFITNNTQQLQLPKIWLSNKQSVKTGNNKSLQMCESNWVIKYNHS